MSSTTTIRGLQNVHIAYPLKVTRENQLAGGFYELEDGSVMVVNQDGEGRHWYDDYAAAYADHGSPAKSRIHHVASHQIVD